jgi:putative sigma-54 modulation protein
MRIEIQTSCLTLQPEHRAHILRRTRSALARISPFVHRVAVHLSDLNGPRGGVDKRCRVMVHIDNHPTAVVEDYDSDLSDLIDRSLKRAGRAGYRRLTLGTLRRNGWQPRRPMPDLIEAY